MKPLYEITNEYQHLISHILECDELSQDQISALELIEDTIQNKAINVAAFIRNLESDADAIKNALDKMKERLDKTSKKIEYLRYYLKDNLEKCNLKEVKSPYFDVKIKINPAAVCILDEALIPLKYITEKISTVIDKSLISRELKNNIMIPGVKLEQRTRLEIK